MVVNERESTSDGTQPIHVDGRSAEEVARVVIGAAMRVMNALGPGLPEKCYENALMFDLIDSGYEVSQQARFPVVYNGRKVGTLIPDLIVDRMPIADPKIVDAIGKPQISQMLTCLAVTGLPLALLINFRSAKIAWRQVHPPT